MAGVGKSTIYKAVIPHLKGVTKLSEFKNAFSYVNFSKEIKEDETIQFLASNLLSELNNMNFHATDKFNFIPYFLNILKNDFLQRKVQHPYTIIEDGGLVHNFSSGIIKLYEKDFNLFKKLIQDRIIIYCYSSPEKIAEQIIHREKLTGQKLPFHQYASYEELVESQINALRESQKLMDILKNHEIQILFIDTSEPIEKNIELIKSFINKVSYES